MLNQDSRNQQASPEDKRYIPRWEVDNRIVYQVNEDEAVQEARSRDLSCVGVCVQMKQNVTLNQKIKLTIYLTDSVSIQVTGVVLWIKKIPEGTLAGVIFENTKPETQETILDYAFEIKREDLVKHWFKGWDK